VKEFLNSSPKIFTGDDVDDTSYVHSISPYFSFGLSGSSVVELSPLLFDRIIITIIKNIRKRPIETPIIICFFNFANASVFIPHISEFTSSAIIGVPSSSILYYIIVDLIQVNYLI
jgi:hypothetical protein